MDVVLRDSHLDTSIVRDNQMNVIVPSLECAGGVRERSAKLVKKFKTV